jgi:hypothetical protein
MPSSRIADVQKPMADPLRSGRRTRLLDVRDDSNLMARGGDGQASERLGPRAWAAHLEPPARRSIVYRAWKQRSRNGRAGAPHDRRGTLEERRRLPRRRRAPPRILDGFRLSPSSRRARGPGASRGIGSGADRTATRRRALALTAAVEAHAPMGRAGGATTGRRALVRERKARFARQPLGRWEVSARRWRSKTDAAVGAMHEAGGGVSVSSMRSRYGRCRWMSARNALRVTLDE